VQCGPSGRAANAGPPFATAALQVMALRRSVGGAPSTETSRLFDISIHSSDGSFETQGAQWMADTDKCTICNVKIGKMKLNPRHHCRLCGRCVCHKCSPSTTEVKKYEGPQRVCEKCVGKAFKQAQLASKARGRLKEVASQLCDVSGTDIFEIQVGDVEEAVTACELAADGVERSMSLVREDLAKSQACADISEAALAETRSERDEAMRDLSTERKAKDELQEALATCEVSLRDSNALCSMEQLRRSELHNALKLAEERYLSTELSSHSVAELPQAQPRADFAEHPVATEATAAYHKAAIAFGSNALTSTALASATLASTACDTSLLDSPAVHTATGTPVLRAPRGRRAAKCVAGCRQQ